ncbi:MAG: TRAP transporter substrate-binding protein, partial [Clostridiales bacterium]|nr:TRAP transporter substrate-binding protein [Clostridiales bacterium]
MKKLLSVALAGAMALSLIACGNSSSSTASTTAAPAAAEKKEEAAAPAADGKVIELNLAHTLDAEHPVNLGAEYFADKLAELSGGTMHVTVYPNSGLGDEDEVAEIQSYSDSITFSLPSGCVLQNYTGAAYAFDFYFQFDNYDQVWKFYDGEYGDYVKKDLEGTGLKVLNYWDNGFRNLTTTDKEVHTPADLKGMKIRVMNAETHLAAWNAIGAAATPIAYAEVYSALQQGVVDGEENPVFNIYGSRFQEVQKYVHMDRHVHDVSPFIV